MNFKKAMGVLKAGKKVRRRSFVSKSGYVERVFSETYNKDVLYYVDIERGIFGIEYTAKWEDMNADDWEIYESEEVDTVQLNIEGFQHG